MAKINGNEIRPGNVIEHDGGLWVAVKTNAVKPGKGGAYNQVELKNLINGTKLNERFRAAETVEKVRDRLNPRLRVDGILATMHDPRTLHSREVLDRVSDRAVTAGLGAPAGPGGAGADPTTGASALPVGAPERELLTVPVGRLVGSLVLSS